MIRKLTLSDNDAAMQFLLPESAFNLFIIGDIENFGYDSPIQDVWADIDEQQAIRAVLLRYYAFYIFYTPHSHSAYCDAEGLAAIVNSDPGFELISGKKEALSVIAPYLRVARSKELFFARLDNSTLLGTSTEPAIQKAGFGDVDAIIALRSTIEEFHTSPAARDSLISSMENGSAHTYYYSVGGQMLACASTTAENSQSAMIIGVCTLPGHRRKGYATMCMTALCRELLGRNKFLCLFYDNPEAGRIYKRMGFYDIGMYSMLYAAPTDVAPNSSLTAA